MARVQVVEVRNQRPGSSLATSFVVATLAKFPLPTFRMTRMHIRVCEASSCCMFSYNNVKALMRGVAVGLLGANLEILSAASTASGKQLPQQRSYVAPNTAI